ncbi:YceI family protein [Jiangella anatolica]|uniref:Polyisoprenoid-binding protein n=1 Tax=Jiangella anatolica TaxID=2670374 RepID=A0A2W2B8A6_9ACTN|nr:YceI family protein [Jiangella anatolica]PZF83721.1 polyisoprenoid-binding protein [Jiangella anatolica]
MAESDTDRNVHPWNGLTVPAAGDFTLDPEHADVTFAVRYLMVTQIKGRFGDVRATLTLGEDPTASHVEVVVGTASLATGEDDRDQRLRSADFFDVARHPELTFRSTRITHVRGNEFVLAGDLTIRGTTRPVEFGASFDGVGFDPWGAQVVGLSARTEIDRERWGLTWNRALETGGVLIGKTVVLEIDAEFNRPAGSARETGNLAP